ncbi:MAG: tetratricopeptide repeat protein [Planctomycetes bacterium]|nr:tetratricopeptide repeat protein [Planctomycetota bacterium]
MSARFPKTARAAMIAAVALVSIAAGSGCLGPDKVVIDPSHDARMLMMTGDYEAAIATLDDVIRENPGDAEAYAERGQAHVEQGDLDGAIADFGASIRLEPGATTYLSRALAYQQKGELDRAITDCTAALDRNPDYASALRTRADLYSQQAKPDQAAADMAALEGLDKKVR